MEPKRWVPRRILEADRCGQRYAITVLNRPILLKPATFVKLWNGAKVRVLVDGGANRWIKFVSNFCKGVQILPPDFLSGDLDSITSETKTKLIQMGCRPIGTPEQDETDFTKSLLVMKAYFVEHKIDFVINIVEFSGRIDHILSQINTLFKANNFLKDVDVYLMTKNSLCWILAPGAHVTTVPEIFVKEQRWCSYAPVGAKTNVSTTGFKWDLKNHSVKFGGIVSSSNTYAKNVVTLNCDNYLFWSMATDADSSNEID